MTRAKAWEVLLLALLVLAELWAFSGTFGKFFNHDSIFYMIYSPRTWGEVGTVLTSPDAARQYRPLSLGFTALLLPIFGMDPRPYHWVPLAFHIANTLLLWLFARRLLHSATGALAAAGFWGLHSVAGWVTYDITYISDFMLAFFVLVSLLLGISGYDRRSAIRIAGSFVFYVAALLTKEAAVILPVAFFLCLAFIEIRKSDGGTDIRERVGSLQKVIPYCAAYLLLAAALAGLLIHWLIEGRLYAQGSGSPYDINPWANLAAKLTYVPWAFNLPDRLSVPHNEAVRMLATLAVVGVLLVWGLSLLLRRLRLSLIEWVGVLWLIAMTFPAFMLSHRLAKWYLYVPLLGLALAFGSLVDRMKNRVTLLPDHLAGSALLGLLLVPWFFSTTIQTRSFINSSDSSYISDVVENCLRDFQDQHPTLPPALTLYVLPTFEKNVAEFFGNGYLYQLYYPSSNSKMLFADRDDKLPNDYLENANVWVLQYLYGHVYDVTSYYKGRARDADDIRVVDGESSLETSMNPEEYYPPGVPLGTMGGGPVFFPTPDKKILTQIAGSTVKVSLPRIPPRSRLRFDVAWMHDAGDGGWAEMRLQTRDQSTVLFREYLKSNPKRQRLRWREVQVGLDAFEGLEAGLILKCYNEKGNNTIADWLNWRDIALDRTPGETEAAPPSARSISRTARREGATPVTGTGPRN